MPSGKHQARHGNILRTDLMDFDVTIRHALYTALCHSVCECLQWQRPFYPAFPLGRIVENCQLLRTLFRNEADCPDAKSANLVLPAVVALKRAKHCSAISFGLACRHLQCGLILLIKQAVISEHDLNAWPKSHSRGGDDQHPEKVPILHARLLIIQKIRYAGHAVAD
jgi:hypothetical protein